MTRPFNVFQRPPSNYHMGETLQNPNQQAVQSNYRVGGTNIYQNQDGNAPMSAEVSTSPITDPNIANAVSRVTYAPQRALITRTPEAMVAQPMTYESAARKVDGLSYEQGMDPSVFTAFQPPPIQRNDILPQEGQVNTIPSPGRLARDGGLLLPPPSERYAISPETQMLAREQQEADIMMRLAANRAKYNGGVLQASGANSTITTPTTTGVTIPFNTAPPPAPTPPYTESLATIIRKPFQKLQGALATPEQIAPGQLRREMVPSQQIQVRRKGIPWWVLALAAGGAYFAFKGE